MADTKRTTTALDKLLRVKTVDALFTVLSTQGEDVLRIDGKTLAYPTVNEDGEDTWVEIAVTIPKGEKIEGGFLGYDGYERAKAYVQAQEAIAEKERKRQEKAASDIAKRKATKKPKTEPTAEE